MIYIGNPKYRVRASGFGGSGYATPAQGDAEHGTIKNADGEPIEVALDADGKPIIKPGVTTVLKALGDGPGLTQWKIDQTVMYLVANVDGILNRTELQGFKAYRFWHKRKPDPHDPYYNAHKGVLNDLADLGTKIHEYTEAERGGHSLPPVIDSEPYAQMVDAWHDWLEWNTFEPVVIEGTVWHDEFGGTFDDLAYVNGVLTLLDKKSSRRIGEHHKMQLSALRKALLEGKNFGSRAGGVWFADEIPKPEQYGFMKIRPDDYDNNGNFIPRHAEFTTITEDELDIRYQQFDACLRILAANRELKRKGLADD